MILVFGAIGSGRLLSAAVRNRTSSRLLFRRVPREQLDEGRQVSWVARLNEFPRVGVASIAAAGTPAASWAPVSRPPGKTDSAGQRSPSSSCRNGSFGR